MITGCRWTDERHCCSCRHRFESHLLPRRNAENGSLTDFLLSWSFFSIQKTSDRLQYYMEKNAKTFCVQNECAMMSLPIRMPRWVFRVKNAVFLYSTTLNFLESFLILRLSSLCEICSKNRRILCFNFFPSSTTFYSIWFAFHWAQAKDWIKNPSLCFNDEISTTFFRFFVVWPK